MFGETLTECFTRERIESVTAAWDRYYTPEFVDVLADGTIAFDVQRVPAGPVGGMMVYQIRLDQKTAAPVTISGEGRCAIPGEPGYSYRLGAVWRHQDGTHSGYKGHSWFKPFPGPRDGSWRPLRYTVTPQKPIRTLELHVALCYSNGKAEVRNLSVKTASASLK